MTECTEIYRQLLSRIQLNEPVALFTELPSLHRKLIPVSCQENEYHGRIASVSYDGHTLTEPVFPGERLIILGGGHVAKAVCRMAADCGFSCYVCDDRAEFVTEERFPQAKRRSCMDFTGYLQQIGLTSFDYVVIVTRGHEYDADCLRVILSGNNPSYTGIIGSRKRVARLKEELAAEGYDREKMARICTPIGLPIGAVTPEEIAVSILAELIAYRRLPAKSEGRVLCASDLELSVIEALAVLDRPAALATILMTQGSCPRKAGAKMLVYADGSICGTIGGGFAENRIKEEALSLISSGKNAVLSVDMSGETAKNDGMVCGGVMSVLLEDIGVI